MGVRLLRAHTWCDSAGHTLVRAVRAVVREGLRVMVQVVWSTAVAPAAGHCSCWWVDRASDLAEVRARELWAMAHSSTFSGGILCFQLVVLGIGG